MRGLGGKIEMHAREEIHMRLKSHVSMGVLMLALAGGPALADDAAIKKWVDTEFQPSTLSKDNQTKELQWFAKAAEPRPPVMFSSKIDSASMPLSCPEWANTAYIRVETFCRMPQTRRLG